MSHIKPTHLAAIGCFAIACAGPAASNYNNQTQIQESRAEFAGDRQERSQSGEAKATLKKVGKRGLTKRTVGTLELEQRGKWVTLIGQFRHLPRGMHGLQIREEGDCSGKGARKAGGHFNPTDTRHGPPSAAKRHVGDLGNIEVDRKGRAVFEMKTNSLTVTKDGPSSVLGRSVVITENKDDGRSQPHGNAGPAIACGVIR